MEENLFFVSIPRNPNFKGKLEGRHTPRKHAWLLACNSKRQFAPSEGASGQSIPSHCAIHRLIFD